MGSNLAPVLPLKRPSSPVACARLKPPGPSTGSRVLSRTLPFQLQGAILVASCVQMLVGFSGLIGFLMRFIGPLTIAPTIALMALPLFDSAGNDAGIHWGIAAT